MARTGLTSRFGSGAVDAAIAVALLILSLVEVWWSPAVEHSRAATATAALIMTGALAFRRRWPTATALVVNGAVATLALVAGLPNVVFLVPVALLALYSLGAYAESDRSVIGLAATLVAVPLGAIRTEDPTVTDLTAPVVLFGAAWAGGRAMRARKARDIDLQGENARLVREQAFREQLAAGEERRRIARELHDIVAHRVTTIVIQAESGAATAEDADRARTTFSTIASMGRESLDELRRLLGLLREDVPPSASPAPGLAGLTELVENVRGAGMPIETSVDGDLDGLPAGIDLALYRIIQESLTNALRHSGTSATLLIRRTTEGVKIEVRNPVHAGAVRPGTQGAGSGLAGMRERAKIYDGTVTAGARDGQWVVQAALPVARPDR